MKLTSPVRVMSVFKGFSFHIYIVYLKKDMHLREIKVKTILSRSQIYEYTLNPYVGCFYACVYCYARFMKIFSGHSERWGDFVDVKINAPELLRKEIEKKKLGRVWISGVCDPYQPLEKRYRLTRKCLEIFVEKGWPVTIQTKSPLVLRDLDLIKGAKDIEVGFTITTADDGIRRIFEPQAPTIESRINALKQIHNEGIRTFAMIAPVLPHCEGLVERLRLLVDYIIIDRMNYHYADWVYKRYGLEWAMTDGFFTTKARILKEGFEKEGITCEVVF